MTMADWKFLIADKLGANGRAILSHTGSLDYRPDISIDDLFRDIPAYHALVVRSRTNVSADLIKTAARLKVIGRAGVGVDNIDLEAAKSDGIIVVNSPTATSLSVAELTLGMVFALAREIPRADLLMKAGEWAKKSLVGIEISGKTLGIIGVGNIGSRVSQRASALGMNVIGYDISRSNISTPFHNAQPVGLTELYTRSDFISIHVPLSSDTKYMIDVQAIDTMKTGVRIICTARGGIIDEDALLNALESGQVAGAALDVYQQEPPGSSLLIKHPKIIATPHIGSQTIESQSNAAEDIAKEVIAAIKGEPLRWRIV